MSKSENAIQMRPTKPKVFIYVRQSSGPEENSNSIEIQKQNCLALCENKYEVVAVFEDPNRSGRLYPVGLEDTAKCDPAFSEWYNSQHKERRFRKGFGEMFARLEEVSYVVVDDLTRLARPVRGSFLQNIIQFQFMQQHITILSVKEGKVDYQDFGNRLLIDVQTSITDNQLAIQRKKSMDSMRLIKDDGYYPTMPRMFGVRYLGNRKVTVDKECAECIRFIYGEILKFRPYNAIVADVNQKYGRLFKGTCHPSTFRHIATQIFYAGYMHDSKGNRIPAKQMQGQEVISLDTWENVQGILNQKRGDGPRARFRTHPFTGLLYCGKCGARLVNGFDNDKEYYYCAAGSNSRREQECRESRININLKRESEFYIGLRECLSPLLLLALYKYLDDERMTKREMARLAEYEQEKKMMESRLSDGLLLFTEAGLPRHKLAALAQKCQTRIDQLEERIAELSIARRTEAERKRFHDLCIGKFEELLTGKIEDSVYNMLLPKAIKRIDVFRDHLDLKTPYGPFTLKRYMIGKFRNMPKYRWEKVLKDEKLDGGNLENCIFKITYIYNKENKKVLNVDFKNLIIYEA